MPISNYPNGFTQGVAIRGIPLLNLHGGNVFWVDSNNGADTGKGTHNQPFGTWDYAIGRCTENHGDLIVIKANHAETVTSSIACDVAGVATIMLGTGKSRPAFTCNAAIDMVTVTAANVAIYGLYCLASTLTGVTARINVAAANCTVSGCLFLCGVYDLETITVADAGDDLFVQNCEWRITADGPDAGIEIEANGVDGLQVKNCHFNGGSDTNGWDAGGINSGVTHTNCLIKDNTFLFGPAIIFSSTAKGLIQGNAMGEGTLGSMLDPGSCMCVANYETDAIDESGSLFPQATPVGGGISTDVAAILVDTAEIGTAGAGLTDLGGMSTGMLAEVEAECEDALEGEDLDHLMKLDGATEVYPENCAADSALAKMLCKGDPATPSSYSCVTDSQEMLSDKLGGYSGDGGALIDDSVKAALDLIEAQTDDIGTAGAGLSDLGGMSTAMKAEVEAECVDAVVSLPKCVEKSDGAVLNGLDPIFTISGGPVRAKIVGLVTGAAIGGAATGRLQHITTEPAATVELSAGAVAIDTDPAGTFYYSKGASSIFTPTGGLGFALIDPVTIEETEFLLAPGDVQFLASAAQTGNIKWYMSYIPLSPSSAVVAAT